MMINYSLREIVVCGIFLSFSSICKVKSANVTAFPQQITIGGEHQTSELTIICRPSALGITSVIALEIGKKTANDSKNAILQIVFGRPPSVVDPNLQARMTYNGFIKGASGRLEMKVTDLQCSDAPVTYYCVTSYNAGGIRSDEATVNITALVRPSCNISSNRNLSEIKVDEEISLSVTLQPDCNDSLPYIIILKLGSVSMELTNRKTSPDSTSENKVFKSCFNLTESHFGPVRLIFILDDKQTSLTCDGVQVLVKGEHVLSSPDVSIPQNLQHLSLGVGIGVVAVLMLASLCLLIWKKRKRKSDGVKRNQSGIASSRAREAEDPSRTDTESVSTPPADGEYEMPTNYYDRPGTNIEAYPGFYTDLTTYQNTDK